MERVLPAEPVSIVMPVCDEVRVIADVVDEWQREVVQHLPAGSELLFDDCSSDGTYELLSRLATDRPFLRVLRSERDGFGQAAKRLYLAARNPWVFFTDSDGQYLASELWKLTPELEGADIVHGEKRGRQDPWMRIVASAAFNVLARITVGTRFDDVNSAFRFVRRSVAEALVPQLRHMPTLVNAELLIRAERAGLRVRAVKVAHRPRREGRSRGLPLRTFLKECGRAYAGLRRLEAELGGHRAAPAQGNDAGLTAEETRR